MDFFLRRKVFTYFLIVLLAISGIIATLTITKESFPEIDVPVVAVLSIFPGAPAFDVEESVTDVLETPLVRALDSVKEINSQSQENISLIAIEFDTTKDVNEALQDVRDEIDPVLNKLPDSVDKPVVSQVGFTDIPVFIVAMQTRGAFTELSEIVDDLQDEILDIRGVSGVDVIGQPERQITVILDPTALARYNLNITSIAGALEAANFSLPAGVIRNETSATKISIKGKFTSAEDVRNTIVARTASGEPVHVYDIAVVNDGLAERTGSSRSSTEQSDMQQSVTFLIKKQVGYDVTVLAEDMQTLLAAYQSKNADAGVTFNVVLNDGDTVWRDLSNLSSSAMQTIILVFLVLLIGIGLRESVLAALAVPLSFLIAFVGLLLTDNTINFISLFALIIAIGMLVDSAIVVTEGLSDNFKDPNDTRDLATRAAATVRALAPSVIAGTMTTLAIFVPLMFLSGITGLIIKPVPETMIIVMLGALAVAIFFVPVMGTDILTTKPVVSDFSKKRDRAVARMNTWYRNYLTALLENKQQQRTWYVSIAVLFVASLSLVSFGFIKPEFFPEDDYDNPTIEITAPPGYTLEATETLVADIEDTLRKDERVVNFVSTIDIGTATLYLKTANDKLGKVVVQDLRTTFANYDKAEVQVKPPVSGAAIGAPFEVRFVGDDWGDLTETVTAAAALVKTFNGAVNVDTTIELPSTDIDLLLDRDQIERAGLNVTAVAAIARASLYGMDATSFNHPASGDDTDVTVKTALNPAFTSPNDTNYVTIDAIKNITITTPAGAVPLGNFIREDVVPGTTVVSHRDGDRTVSVTSYLQDGYVAADLNEQFEARSRELTLPEGVVYEFGGSTEDSAEANGQLGGALLAGVLLVLAVLIYQFNSIRKTLLIMSVVPIGLVGVLFGLFIFGQTLSFTALLGFVSLVGIVINNSILLVEMISVRSEDPTISKREAVIDGSVSRLRPILLTTATTVLGMVPLLFTSPMWTPFALAIICGLSFAVVITLVLVPMLYVRYG